MINPNYTAGFAAGAYLVLNTVLHARVLTEDDQEKLDAAGADACQRYCA